MGLGKKIAYYRKNKNITQDALAKLLGISNQAVSKWETDQSYPDVELLPKIADIFGITMDELFDREGGVPEKDDDFSEVKVYDTDEKAETKEPEQESEQETEERVSASDDGAVKLPWEDDGTLRAVLFIGHKMVQVDKINEAFGRAHKKEVTFSYEGAALTIESWMNICCENVEGNVKAGGYVECGEVGGAVAAGGYVECSDVSGNIAAGGYVECGDVKENIAAGGYVECGDVGGDVKAGSYVECDDVKGNVSARGNVECGDVTGDVTAQGDVDCGDIGGCVYNN